MLGHRVKVRAQANTSAVLVTANAAAFSKYVLNKEKDRGLDSQKAFNVVIVNVQPHHKPVRNFSL